MTIIDNPASRLRSAWGEIIQDLALAGSMDKSTLIDGMCNTYNMTHAEFESLLCNPAFNAALEEYNKEFEIYGVNKTLVLRARALSESLMERLYSVAIASGDIKEIREAFKVIADVARVTPASMPTPKDIGSNNTAVVINIPAGIPGMEHLTADTNVIDHIPTHAVEGYDG